MSSRRPAPTAADDSAEKIRSEIEQLKKVAMTTEVAVASGASSSLTFEELNATEQACASLGASPDELRPLGWLNAGHFETLCKNNQLDSDLMRRLEAYKIVAARSQ